MRPILLALALLTTAHLCGKENTQERQITPKIEFKVGEEVQKQMTMWYRNVKDVNDRRHVESEIEMGVHAKIKLAPDRVEVSFNEFTMNGQELDVETLSVECHPITLTILERTGNSPLPAVMGAAQNLVYMLLDQVFLLNGKTPMLGDTLESVVVRKNQEVKTALQVVRIAEETKEVTAFIVGESEPKLKTRLTWNWKNPLDYKLESLRTFYTNNSKRGDTGVEVEVLVTSQELDHPVQPGELDGKSS